MELRRYASVIAPVIDSPVLTLVNPELVVPDPPGRDIFMRRYFDGVLQQEMLMRVVVEHTESETVLVTVYKTSQMGRYLKGLQP